MNNWKPRNDSNGIVYWIWLLFKCFFSPYCCWMYMGYALELTNESHKFIDFQSALVRSKKQYATGNGNDDDTTKSTCWLSIFSIIHEVIPSSASNHNFIQFIVNRHTSIFFFHLPHSSLIFFVVNVPVRLIHFKYFFWGDIFHMLQSNQWY